MRLKLFILLPFFLYFQTNLRAQNKTSSSFEASFNLGLASFQTDYGERGNFKSGVSGNVGTAIGASMYLNFFNVNPAITPIPNWSQKHLKLKLEASYLRARLDHFGRYIEGDTAEALELQNMHGTSSVINFGPILEYHPVVIPDYVTGKLRKVTPYIGGGIMAGYSMPTVVEVADIPAYEKEDVIDVNPKMTFSLIFSGGLRFRLSEISALMVDMRWQSFASDYIDGLNPDNEVLGQDIHGRDVNRSNDWLYYLNVGYVYTFGKEYKKSTWFSRRKKD